MIFLDDKDIWNADDVNCGEEYECLDDTRPQPELANLLLNILVCIICI